MSGRDIVFVGSNPSAKSCTTSPFSQDTISGRILSSWVVRLNINPADITYLNVSDLPTKDNKPLKMSEIRASLPELEKKLSAFPQGKIIALGKSAGTALTLLRLQYFQMDHPSGLNRLNNVPEHVAEKIRGLISYINPQ